MSAVFIRSCGDESADRDAARARDGIKTNEVQRDVLEDGQVVGGVAGAGTHLVIGEDDIHAQCRQFSTASVSGWPGQGVEHRAAGWSDVVALLARGFALDCALGFDDHEGLEIGPLPRIVQAIELIGGKAAAMLDATVVFFDVLVEAGGRLGSGGRLELREEIFDRLGERRMIVLDCQDLVALLAANRLGDVGLRAHRIDR